MTLELDSSVDSVEKAKADQTNREVGVIGMSTPGIKSKPVYTGLKPDTDATHHVLVGEGYGAEALARLRTELTEDNQNKASDGSSVVVFYTAVLGPNQVEELSGDDGDPPKQFSDFDALRRALREYLAEVGMGARLYVAGSETFLWQVVLGARDGVGMSEAAIQLQRCGPPSRPVCCVHCKTTDPAVSTTIYQCPGCGLSLFVRDHFSRRLGVYQGVCVDAEAPGEVPDAEELES